MTSNPASVGPAPDGLLPCPFCGSTSIHMHSNGERLFFWAECSHCDVEARGASDEDDARKQWNTRAHHPDREAEPTEVTREAALRSGQKLNQWVTDAIVKAASTAPASGVVIPRDTAAFCYALLGAADEAEAMAVWSRNPEARFAAHQALSVSPPVVEGALRASPFVPTEGHEAAVVGWRDIATAPRDGATVLLYAAAWEMTWGEVQVGHFEGDGEGSGEWVTPEGAVGDNDPSFDPEAEIPDSDEDDDWNLGPTHWMPLPAAPDTALNDTQPGIFALRENEPKARHQPTTPGEQGEEEA